MAKQLRQPPPSSSVARLLDLTAAARAVAPAIDPPSIAGHFEESKESTKEYTPVASQSMQGTPYIKRELILTQETDATLSQLVELYRKATGSKVTTSHVARSLLLAVHHSMDYLSRESRRIGPLKLPSNARGREQDRLKFEARLADAFLAGMRAAPAADWD